MLEREAVLKACIVDYDRIIRLTPGHRYQVLEGNTWVYVPGVTSLIGQLDKPQLLRWAAKLAIETGDPLAHEHRRDQAAERGTDIHDVLEDESRRLLGEVVAEPVGMNDEVAMVLARWREWAREVEYKPVAIEFRVYHSGLHYCGTVDFLAHVRGELVIGDWKTGGRRIYEDAHLQNIAYRAALGKMTAGVPLDGLIVHVPRDGDHITDVRGSVNLESGMRAFAGLIDTYEWRREIRQELKQEEYAS
jgi:hypothetical protein